MFGFTPWDVDDWSNVDKGWWMNCLADSDGDLAGLTEFLRGDDAAPSSSPASWASQPLNLFLSHLHDHREFVGRVQSVLASYGASAFVAHKDIPSGAIWREEIRGGLRSCDALVAFLHKGFRASQWCDQEVGWALGREIPVIPVCPPVNAEANNGFMDDVQYIVLGSENEWFTARKIIETLTDDDRTRKAALRSVGEALVNSYSFDNTRWVWSLIEPNEAHLEPDTLRRIQYAVATNNQVSAANRADGEPISTLVEQMVVRASLDA
jgi:hypothetical protein